MIGTRIAAVVKMKFVPRLNRRGWRENNDYKKPY